jgi:ParB family chromosome partitioning protein
MPAGIARADRALQRGFAQQGGIRRIIGAPRIMPGTTMPDIVLLPLAEIDEAALSRDRLKLEPEAQAELESSIAASGLRQPIEVFPIEPAGERRWGLIAGYRRLAAFRALLERTGEARFAAIPAFVRERGSLAAALAAMVEENDIRAGVSPFERGITAVVARNQGAFGSIEEAVEGLYPNASKQKRQRLRTLAFFAEEIGGWFTAPETLSERQIERIARAIDGGFGELIRTALEESSLTEPNHQWSLVEPILVEAEEHARNPEVSYRPGRPRRILRPRYHLTVRRERTRKGWCLHFTGREATGMMMDLVLDEIERKYSGG